MLPALDCPRILFAKRYCHGFGFLLEENILTGLFPSRLSSGAVNQNRGQRLGSLGFVGRGSLCPFSVPHSPEQHLKPQYKHKGISPNGFVFKFHLVMTMVREHGCPRRVGAVQGSCLLLGKAPGSLVGFGWRLQGTGSAHVLRLSVPCSSHLLCWVLLNLF